MDFVTKEESLKEEFSAHTFPCRTANAQKQKISSQKQQCGKGIKGPTVYNMGEGQMHEKFHQEHKSAQRQNAAAVNKESAPANVFQKRQQGGEDQTGAAGHRKSKA